MTNKPPGEPRIGMKADEVLKLRGRGAAFAVAPAQWVEQGKSAVWHYRDISVVFEHDGTCYRVKRIVRDAS